MKFSSFKVFHFIFKSAGIRFDSNYPNLKAWFERCKGLKGFEENYEGGKLVTGLLKMRGLPPVSLD